MNLTDYLANEGIKDLSRAKWDSESKQLGREKMKKYKELGEEFFQANTPENIKIFYNFLAREGIIKLFESLYYDRTMQVSPKTLSELQGSKQVLEIGSNSGLKTVYYAINCPQTHFTGIDLSDVSVEVAKNRAKKYGCTNIDFKVQNMLDLQPEPSFDTVLSENFLYETHDMRFGGMSWNSDPIFYDKFSIISPIIKKGKLIISLNPDNIGEITGLFEYLIQSEGFKSSTSERIPYFDGGEQERDLFFVAKK